MKGRGLWFVVPFAIPFSVFVLWPALMGLWMSLHEWSLVGRPSWVGLDNYAALLDRGRAAGWHFQSSLAATAIFVVLSVPPLVVVPLAIALLMNAKIPGRAFFRATFFAPYVLGVAVVGVAWRLLLDPAGGFVNQLFGVDVPWTTELPWAWIALVAVTVWWTMGLNAVIYLAALQDVPVALYEAARLDGATSLQQLVHVTLPSLRPVLALVTTTTLIASANMFGQSYLVTGGGPAHATRTAVMAIAEEGLRRFRLGQSAAMSFVLAALLAVAGVLALRVLSARGDA